MTGFSNKMQETGYFLDKNKVIVGPDGLTEFSLDEDDTLIFNGKCTDVYVEDGYFYVFKRCLYFMSVSTPTGHQIKENGLIIGPENKQLPWEQILSREPMYSLRQRRIDKVIYFVFAAISVFLLFIMVISLIFAA